MARPARKLDLSEAELIRLNKVWDEDNPSPQKLRRAGILIMLHQGVSCKEIAESGEGRSATVSNVKRRYFESGLEYALAELPRSGAPIRISEQDEIAIILLASSAPPEGRARWTLRLLAEEAVEKGFVNRISHNQVKLILRKHNRHLV